MGKATAKMCIFKTKTEGNEPNANGQAEMCIGLLKHDGAMELMECKMPITAWYWAMRQSAIKNRWSNLMIDIPKGAPDFGERVMVRRATSDELPALEPNIADGFPSAEYGGLPRG